MLLLLAGIFRMGILANFLSHSVVSAFITASAIIIAISQFRHLVGIEMHGDNLVDLGLSFHSGIAGINLQTTVLGFGVLLFLLLTRGAGSAVLQRLGIGSQAARILVKTAPVFAVLCTIVLVSWLDLASADVAIVGAIPAGLPAITVPDFSLPWRGNYCFQLP